MLRTFNFRFFVSSLFSLVAIFFLVSCDNDSDPAPNPPAAQAGYFIVNEGGFGNANTSLSYYDRESNSVRNNVFQDVNNRPLGDQTQSMTVFDDRGFIVVQNSAKIEVIDRESFASIATIGANEGIASPRYFIGITSTKGYVSDWGVDGVSGTVKVIDLTTYKVTTSVAVGQGPNKMLLHNNQVYVANSGGFGSDNSVVVIDAETDAIVKTIEVGDNPNSLTVDMDDRIWIAGSGKVVYDPVDFSIVESESTPGFIARLDNDEVVLKILADQINTGPTDITGNQNVLYFRYRSGIYRMTTDGTSIPNSALIDESFYGLAVDPLSGELLTSRSPNFSDDGSFSRYAPSGDLIESYAVGIAPNGFAF